MTNMVDTAEELPYDGLTRHGPMVASSRVGGGVGINSVLVWHFCTGLIRIELTGPTDISDWYPRWIPAGVRAHDFVSGNPLTISPSIYWPDCCGMHGFLTDGVWADC